MTTQTETPTHSPPTAHFGILLVPGYPVYVLTLIIESLRIANKLMQHPVYEWRVLTTDGLPAQASNGMTVAPNTQLMDNLEYEYVCVLSGYGHEAAYLPQVFSWLNRHARRGSCIGGLDTGAFILAKAGLLNHVPIVVHWEAVDVFREEYPGAKLSEHLFCIEGHRFTGAGGAAVLDLMLNLISADHGVQIARRVAQDFIHDQIRPATNNQRIAYDHQWEQGDEVLSRIVALMEENIEEPLSRSQLTKTSQISSRQLERCFQRDLGTSMMRHYRNLRLKRARHLVLYGAMPIRQVALACGYSSLAVFSRAYRSHYEISPTDHRRRFLSAGLSAVGASTDAIALSI